MTFAIAEDEVEREVARRLAELRADREKLLVYDRNGDGIVDEDEWELVRRAITAEVRTSRQRGREPSAGAGAPREVLRGRYELIDDIGRGGQARTYRARDRGRDETVAVKELDLEKAADWKAIELFEREGEVLGSLEHPGIPGYIDAFSLESADGAGMRFFLVQEFVAGRSLQACIDAGELFDEARAREFMAKMFAILDYLHGKSPPVIHRDIKPSNILVRPDGSLALVDFGAVQQIVHGRMGGETVVGTSGFLPPEQLMGRACQSSDLYALAATVVYAMSGEHPSDLPVRQMRLQYHHVLRVSAPFEAYLDRMLAPFVEERFETVAEARGALEAIGTSVPQQALARRQRTAPARRTQTRTLEDGRVTLETTPERLRIVIEPMRNVYVLLGGVLGLVGGLALAIFVDEITQLRILGALIALAGLVVPIENWTHEVELRINRTSFRLESTFLGISSTTVGSSRHLYGLSTIKGDYSNELVLSEGSKDHEFGQGLSLHTKEVIRQTVNDFLEGGE